MISFSAVAFGVSFLEYLMSQADKILIGFYLNAREVGIYAVAMALVAFLPIVLQSVNQIFSPTIADLYARGQIELLGRIFQTLTKWILGFTMPLAAGMVIFAPALMRIFGRDFEIGSAVLVIGTLGQLINCAVGSVGYLLLMSGNQRSLIRIQAVMACGILGAERCPHSKMGNHGRRDWSRRDQCRHQRLVSPGSAAQVRAASLQPQLLAPAASGLRESLPCCCC